MAKKVLGLSFGRRNKNCDIMVKAALMECEKAGCEVKFIHVDDLDIKPCTGCISCVVGMTTGRGKGGCVLKDDFHIVDEALMECDGLIVGCPTYETSPTGRFKTVCDRIGPSHNITFRKSTYEEGLAASKEPDKLPDPRSFKKRVGAFIAVGGAMTENWLEFMLPLMYDITFSMSVWAASTGTLGGVTAEIRDISSSVKEISASRRGPSSKASARMPSRFKSHALSAEEKMGTWSWTTLLRQAASNPLANVSTCFCA